MKRIILFLILVQFAIIGNAQILKPVKWSFSSKKINVSLYEIHITATISNGWHIYSQTTPAGGPVPTTITMNSNPLLKFEEKIKEIGKLEKRNEPLFGVDVFQFSTKVDFVQTIHLIGKVKTSATGTVKFMVCNEKQCLPPATENFSIVLK